MDYDITGLPDSEFLRSAFYASQEARPFTTDEIQVKISKPAHYALEHGQDVTELEIALLVLEEAESETSTVYGFLDNNLRQVLEEYAIRRADLWTCIEYFRHNHVTEEEAAVVAGQLELDIPEMETFRARLLGMIDSAETHYDLANPDLLERSEAYLETMQSLVRATRSAFRHYPPTLLDDMIDLRTKEVQKTFDGAKGGLDLRQLVRLDGPSF